MKPLPPVVQNKLVAVWLLIIVLTLSPITNVEMDSLSIDDQSFDTSGRDGDDYCEQYDGDPQACSNDPLCETEYDDGEHECEDIDEEDDEEDDEDYCCLLYTSPSPRD